MSSIIQRLDPQTINQIAAGEVIVNPASVVKELVDNALDAGASMIRVEVQGGGRQLIRVVDNGSGMCKEDAELCFELHATSKLSKIGDLECLSTMGFRGEALASIGAIAKVHIKTKLKGAKTGTWVQFEGGSLLSSQSIPCDEGTLISVEELFYNIPARKKYLKSPRQENGEIQKTLSEIALSHLSVSFQLVAEGKVVLDLKADSLMKRSQALLQLEEKEWVEVDLSRDGFSLKGLISTPAIHRPQRTGHFLFLNKRPIHPWPLSQAVMQGYGSLLPEGRYPLFILDLSLHGSSFDVNVHPQKRQVRFRFENELKEQIASAVASSFHRTFQPRPAWESSPNVYQVAEPRIHEVCETVSIPMDLPLKSPDFVQVVGTIPGYILVEKSPLHGEERGLCFVDQKRAEARIAYEKALQKGMGEGQILLVPVAIQLDIEESLRLAELSEKLSQEGFGWSEREGAFLLEQAPQWALKEPEESFRSYLEKGQSSRKSVQRTPLKRLLVYDAMLLMRELGSCKEPYTSPQGKPVFGWMGEDQLEKLF